VSMNAASLALIVVVIVSAARGSQPIDVRELATYRLTTRVFEDFARASRLIADVARNDPAFVDTPLFTRDVLVADDAAAAASALEARLQGHAGLRTALRQAMITPREYTRFAIALFAARLAHGFMASGAIRFVPPGAATENVQFVAAHLTSIGQVLKTLGIDDAQSP
jgi:hypothetical protein